MRKLYKFLCKAEEAACGAGLVFLVILILISALGRWLKISQSWYIDLAMLALAWTSFLGADVAWRHGQILGVDILVRKLPTAIRVVVELLVLLIILATLIIIVIFGIRLAWVDRLAKYQSMPIPYSLVTFSLVVASSSMILTTVNKIRKTIIGLVRKGSGRTLEEAVK
jgi:TRAP-type C4-dicarboxylate transport system permease small subunit